MSNANIKDITLHENRGKHIFFKFSIIVKLREREGQWVDLGRSFIDGGWWMVDILSLMLYTKFGCVTFPPPPPPPPPPNVS